LRRDSPQMLVPPLSQPPGGSAIFDSVPEHLDFTARKRDRQEGREFVSGDSGDGRATRFSLPRRAVGAQVLGPPNIEKKVGLTGGHLFQRGVPPSLCDRRLEHDVAEAVRRGVLFSGSLSSSRDHWGVRGEAARSVSGIPGGWSALPA
jgi:hypothetical protein